MKKKYFEIWNHDEQRRMTNEWPRPMEDVGGMRCSFLWCAPLTGAICRRRAERSGITGSCSLHRWGPNCFKVAGEGWCATPGDCAILRNAVNLEAAAVGVSWSMSTNVAPSLASRAGGMSCWLVIEWSDGAWWRWPNESGFFSSHSADGGASRCSQGGPESHNHCAICKSTSSSGSWRTAAGCEDKGGRQLEHLTRKKMKLNYDLIPATF